MKKFRVVFMGTPEFAVPCLKMLSKQTEVVGVVTQPDKPRGRGQKMMASPVKAFAEEQGIPVYQPVKVREEEFIEVLENLKPDLSEGNIFKPDQAFYAAASVGNETYVIYLYSRSKSSGAVLGMDVDGSYGAAWFDPRTGETVEIGEIRADAQGTWTAPEKPGADDYALILRKK